MIQGSGSIGMLHLTARTFDNAFLLVTIAVAALIVLPEQASGQCDNSTHCNSRALPNTTISGTSPNCTCECFLGWGAPDCASCATGFTGTDCDGCATGYSGEYCLDACRDVDVSCSGAAYSVWTWRRYDNGTRDCRCGCHLGYSGDLCDTCLDGFNQTATSPRLVCEDLCTHKENSCLNNALEVGGTAPNCNCTCQSNFAGSRCQFCAEGYHNYPSCTEACSSTAVSCNGRATTVEFSPDGCVCSCVRGWGGALCDRCADGFENDPRTPGVNCTKCRDRFEGPNCEYCVPPWTGVNCTECRPGLDPSTNCTTCLTGYDPAPLCPESCDDAAVSCNGQGTPSRSTPVTCKCDCNTGWDPTTKCATCLPGYVGATCQADTCTDISVSCNGNADSFNDTDAPLSCNCQCKTNFTGARCEQCAEGYSGYPDCTDACTDIRVSCSGHASRVVPASGGGCTCTCLRGFSGAACGVCAIGFYGYPNCQDECTNLEASCGVYGSQQVGEFSDCQCFCKPGYDGAFCDQCAAGYIGFPTCVVDDCTNVTATCNGRQASSNLVNATPGHCVCSCDHGYTGDRCTDCAPGFLFNSVTGACDDLCINVTASCNGNAVSVSRDGSNCVCFCEPGFRGGRCNQCALGYGSYPNCADACRLPYISCSDNANIPTTGSSVCPCDCFTGYTGGTCDSCASGYAGYPTCVPDDCTSVLGSCNGHASALVVSADNTTCNCTCDEGYAAPHCGECMPGYSGYPNCRDDCTLGEVSCSGNGQPLMKLADGCLCECNPGYAGARCEVCATGFSGTPPNCYNDCTDPFTSCSGQGLTVTGTDQNCRCTCNPRFTGSICQRCADGYVNPPECFDDCRSIERSCHAPGTATITAAIPRCTCNCKHGWAGDRCEICNVGYTGSDCSVCANGFEKEADGVTCGVPCPSCTVASYCNGNAWNASASTSGACGCACNCKHGLGGARCDRCDIGFAPPGTCDRCATPGFADDFPLCTNQCTNVFETCLGHGTSILPNAQTGVCECVCHRNFQGTNCDACAVGYVNYPNCSDACTDRQVSCNGVGTPAAASNAANCFCDCPLGFSGLRCEKCATGYIGFPNCVEACTNLVASCNDRATSVKPIDSGNLTAGCNCSCTARYNGSRCEKCADGFYGYPTCVQEDCRNPELSCHGNAVQVIGTSPHCVCECKPGFAGDRCNQCAFGYGSNYPYCIDDCTNANVSCTSPGRGTAVQRHPTGAGCLCTCDQRYRGDQCQVCNHGWKDFECVEPLCNSVVGNCYDHATSVIRRSDESCKCTCRAEYAGDTCERCATGYDDWPRCVDACRDISVSCFEAGATNVSGSLGDCACSCKTGFNGTRCERCASGYGGWPNCALRNCETVVNSCNGRAFRVNGIPPNCECDCIPGYAGRFCDRCAEGFVGWPDCEPDCRNVTSTCNGRAGSIRNTTAPGATRESCECECFKQYSGPRCEYCGNGYFLGSNGQCIDDCTVSEKSCNGHGIVSRATDGTCLCTCSIGFAGDACDRCAANYLGYPTCEENICDKPSSCNGHGQPTGGTAPTCVCECIKNYVGPNSLCSECAVGYRDYPDCVPDCTTVDGSCNNRAFSVTKGADGQCQCSCHEGYAGATCDECAPGYVWGDVLKTYCQPDCVSLESSCSGHAILLDGVPGSCVCYCRPEYAGERCELCAAGRGGYPNCFADDCTSVVGSCNGRATAVRADAATDDCVCTCLEGHEGARCESCAAGYSILDRDNNLCLNNCTNVTMSCSGHGRSVAPASNFNVTKGEQHCNCTCESGFAGPTCGECAAGYTDWPTCRDACSEVAISCDPDGAVNVTGINGACQCGCKPRVTGQRCDRCESGYGAFPLCVEDCTDPMISCNGHGVTVIGTWPTCVCTECTKGYAGTRCDRCAAGFESYPTCRDRCSVSTSCSGNAVGVTGTAGNCVCACLTGYAEPDCATCASGYDGSPCVDDCSNATVSCGFNAVTVDKLTFGTAYRCECTCNTGWAGERCDTCATGFTGSNCSQCAVGYNTSTGCTTCSSGYAGDPCVESCTDVVASCSGHASGVAPSTPGVCGCTCLTEYTGDRCDRCGNGYGVDYPLCVDNCSNVNVSCSGGHATDVYGAAGICTCQCKPNYRGLLCDLCSLNYTNYPDCVPDCTDLLTSCGPYAVGFGVGGSPGNCNCTCRHGFQGSQCDECLPGYGTFPNCSERCDNMNVSCNAHADSANPDGNGACTCNCHMGYTGARCDQCSTGYAGYPMCIDNCSAVDISCTAGAVAVEQTSTSGVCNCTCRPGLRGAQCEQCGDRIGNHPDCDTCADGYRNFPLCTDACTNGTISCNSRGTPNGIFDSCTCACDTSFGGLRCETCATGYSFGAYPNCTDDCSIDSITCGSFGSIVPGSNATHCECACQPRYGGARCETCAPGYHNVPACNDACTVTEISCNASFSLAVAPSSEDSSVCECACKPRYAGTRNRCEQCAEGFTNFPDCIDACTSVNVSCNGHAESVTGTAPDCRCTCRPGFNATARCGSCTAGYTGFPECRDACSDVSISCVAPAVAVTVNTTTGNCRCSCESPLVTGDLCDRCVEGYNGFPNCVEDCSSIAVSCNGAATAVAKAVSYTAAEPACQCTCNTGFTGARCEACVTGYGGWPNCQDDCSEPDISCNGNAVRVAGTTGACVCTCRPGYRGLLCDECIPGYGPYPTCVDNCTNTVVSCALEGEHALSVSGTPPQCQCECQTGFGGRLCDRCRSGFSGFPDCRDACDSTAASCNGNALAVSKGPGGSCQCTCLQAFAGDRCERCNANHVQYPDCFDNCTSVAISCGPRGVSVQREPTSAAPGWACGCTCFRGYEGRLCSTCTRGFARLNPNDVTLPCVDACSDVSASCTPYATDVLVRSTTGGTDGGPLCSCTCMRGYAGHLCDECAAGFQGYPNCVEDCTSVAASCSDNAALVDSWSASELANTTLNVTATPCKCTCKPGFAGGRCDQCAAGYRGYPSCVDECTIVSVSCGRFGTEVERAVTWTPDAPTCACRCQHGYANGTTGISTRCDQCAAGFAGFPTCVSDCTTSVVSDCGPYGASVSPTSQVGVCDCTCRPRFGGTLCDRCAAGYAGFSNCQDECTVSNVSCAANGTLLATSPSGTPGAACECSCPNPGMADGTGRCRTCKTVGYNSDYPVCSENCQAVAVSCNSHASAVRLKSANELAASGSSASPCVCTCSPGFAGERCGACAPGFGPEYPICRPGAAVPFARNSSGIVDGTRIRTDDLTDLITLRIEEPMVYFAPDPGTLWRCITFTVRRDSAARGGRAPLGLETRLAGNIQPDATSFHRVNGTLTIRLRKDPDYDSAYPEHVDLTLTSACFTPAGTPSTRGPITVQVDPPTADVTLTAVASGLAGASGAAALASLSPAAAVDVQSIAVLSLMPCADAGSRQLAPSVTWVLAPFTFGGGDTSLLLGAWAPFLICVVFHAVACGTLYVVRRGVPAPAGTMRARHPMRATAAAVGLPGLTIIALHVFYRGILVGSLRIFSGGLTAPDDANDSTGGLDVGAALLAAVALVSTVAALLGVGIASATGVIRLTFIPGAAALAAQARGATLKQRMYAFLFPDGKWVPEDEGEAEDSVGGFRSRFAPGFFEFRRLGYAGILPLHGAATMALAAGWQPGDVAGCRAQFSLLAAWYLIGAAIVARGQPYASGLLDSTSIAFHVLMAIVCIANAVRLVIFTELMTLLLTLFVAIRAVILLIIFGKMVYDRCFNSDRDDKSKKKKGPPGHESAELHQALMAHQQGRGAAPPVAGDDAVSPLLRVPALPHQQQQGAAAAASSGLHLTGLGSARVPTLRELEAERTAKRAASPDTGMKQSAERSVERRAPSHSVVDVSPVADVRANPLATSAGVNHTDFRFRLGGASQADTLRQSLWSDEDDESDSGATALAALTNPQQRAPQQPRASSSRLLQTPAASPPGASSSSPPARDPRLPAVRRRASPVTSRDATVDRPGGGPSSQPQQRKRALTSIDVDSLFGDDVDDDARRQAALRQLAASPSSSSAGDDDDDAPQLQRLLGSRRSGPPAAAASSSPPPPQRPTPGGLL